MKHVSHEMHRNSLDCYQAEEAKLSARAQAIYDYLERHGPRTDRQLMREMGFQDMNAIRPRVTELIDAGKLMELQSVRCEVTRKTVRRVDLRRPRQMELPQ